MEREQLLEAGKKLAGEIYEKMGVIEQCTSVAGTIEGLPICFLDEDGKLIGLEKVLTEEQTGEIRDSIIKTIYENSAEAEQWLQRLNTATLQPTSVHNESKTEKTTSRTAKQKKQTTKEEQVEKNITVKKREKKQDIEIDEKKLAEMYVRQGMTLQEIAEEIGTDKKAVYEKVEEYGLKGPTGMSESERGAWEKRVMERYR